MFQLFSHFHYAYYGSLYKERQKKEAIQVGYTFTYTTEEDTEFKTALRMELLTIVIHMYHVQGKAKEGGSIG